MCEELGSMFHMYRSIMFHMYTAYAPQHIQHPPGWFPETARIFHQKYKLSIHGSSTCPQNLPQSTPQKYAEIWTEQRLIGTIASQGKIVVNNLSTNPYY